MNIGDQLKISRMSAQLTQEYVADTLNVSRQTISNWENEKSYPDLVYLIQLSDLYELSLDVLVKGDEKMKEHLEKSTDVVSSNHKVLKAIIINIVILVIIIILFTFIEINSVLIALVFISMIISTSYLMIQIINKI